MSRIQDADSVRGVSAYFLLFSALSGNHLLMNIGLIIARAWPTDESPISKLLGIVQVTLPWLCSLNLLAVSLPYISNSSEVSSISANPDAINVIYIIDCLILIAFTLIPPRINRSHPNMMGIDMLMGISGFFYTWMSLVFVILQFYWQLLEFQLMSGSPGSLSLPSLGLRAVVMLAVAVRWFQRLRVPRFGEGNGDLPLKLWYQWGWLPFSCGIEGIGCALLVGMYLRAGWMGATLSIAGKGRL